MKKLNNILSNDTLLELVGSTIRGIEAKNCYFNQLHYVNRNFVDKNFNLLRDIMVQALSETHPGICRDDIAYVNDFVAPVNLENSAVRPVSVFNKENKYQWHIDSIDQWLGPCYNLWIPLYRQQALKLLDERSLFDVMTRDDVPQLYEQDGVAKTNYLTDSASQTPDYLRVAQDFSGLDKATLSQSYLYYDAKGKIGVLPKSEIKTHSVIKPVLGDAYLFEAGQFHSSGPSAFERIGISMKFMVTNPKLGFKEHNAFRYPAPMSGWEGLFAGCYAQFKNFTAFKKYIDLCIVGEQVELRNNQDKLDNICSVLRDVEKELKGSNVSEQFDSESDYKFVPGSSAELAMETGFL